MHNTINMDDWCDGIETCDQCTPYVQMHSAFAKIYAVVSFSCVPGMSYCYVIYVFSWAPLI